ncbi:Aquaporin-1-like protein 2 [Colletotrichum chlorophyti]|uniref:Aquaporin-1-like protein 2 n=1 Tax=Colletotrichum chlorophyti TaxID=708187 RepID=A0A1Q8RX77_9PEZI|nr:Aquaporin-1-like protein 2 [Colletotrichum chlorophyti]
MSSTEGLNAGDRRGGFSDGVVRQPTTHLSTLERHLVAAMGEFIGTFLFLYFGYAGHLMVLEQASDTALDGSMSSQTIIFAALAYTFALLVNVWAFYRVSGGLFNPAVTFGLALAGILPWLRAVILVIVQLLASMCAGGLVNAMFPGDIAQTNTVLGDQTSIVRGVFLEMFFTAQLVIVILMLAVEKSRDTYLAPIGIGLAVFSIMIAGAFVTGASINPARSFGCAVAGTQFPGYHWIYWVGPFMGSLLAAGYYRIVKWAHYEEANPGQDHTGDPILPAVQGLPSRSQAV